MAFVTKRKADQTTPQIVTLIVDDSGSMQGDKAKQATEALQDLVINIQSINLGTGAFRYLLNIAKFGDVPTPLAEAAMPGEVDLQRLVFAGESGTTVMASALTWGAQAIQRSLDRCRQKSNFRESDAPPPIVLFLSDGANTGPDISSAAAAVRNVQTTAGPIDVIACGIGMDAAAFSVMGTIASRPEFAVNIDPTRIAEFIAEAKATIDGEAPVSDLAEKARAMRADG